MLKVGIYIRKSTDQEDNQMLSLEKQRNACNDLLRHIGEHEVVKVWEESISAKKAGKRPGFKEMISMIRKGEINTIVTWKLSRLARNSLDQAYIETYLFEEGKIKIIASQDGIFRPSDNVHLLRIHFGESSQYSRNLGKDASEGMITKVRGGQPVKVPRGYEFDKFKNAVPDRDAPAIREIFRLKRLGISLDQIGHSVFSTHGFSSKGGPLSPTSIEGILKNPIYYGVIRYMGELFEGKFDPIVSYSEWSEANSTNISTRRDRKIDELDFVRGFIFSYETKNSLSPYFKDGLIYFSSIERGGVKTVNISLGKIIRYFDANIEKYSIPSHLKAYFIEAIREFYRKENEDISEARESLARELKMTENKLSNILEMRMNGEIEGDEYKALKNDLIQKKEKFQENIRKYDELDSELLQNSENAFEVLVDLSQTYKNANIIKKVGIIKMITSELFLDHKKALHLAERELFREVRNMSDTLWLGY